jgi:hypothetical protein
MKTIAGRYAASGVQRAPWRLDAIARRKLAELEADNRTTSPLPSLPDERELVAILDAATPDDIHDLLNPEGRTSNRGSGLSPFLDFKESILGTRYNVVFTVASSKDFIQRIGGLVGGEEEVLTPLVGYDESRRRDWNNG